MCRTQLCECGNVIPELSLARGPNTHVVVKIIGELWAITYHMTIHTSFAYLRACTKHNHYMQTGTPILAHGPNIRAAARIAVFTE